MRHCSLAKERLFDDDMRMNGWTNIETKEVKGEKAIANGADAYSKLAFAGIHIISPRLFPMMASYPEKFGIMDFYIRECGKANIIGHKAEELRLMDVGKAETICEAEEFLKELYK